MIKEAKQVGIIYHFTQWENFRSIVEDNFVLSSSSSKYGGVSFTRNYKLPNDNPIDFGGHIVRIAIDGNKLSEKYKITPKQEDISKFGQETADSYHDAKLHSIYSSKDDTNVFRRLGEYEEFFEGKKIDIRNCVIGIDVKPLTECEYNETELERLEIYCPVEINVMEGDWRPYKPEQTASNPESEIFYENWVIPDSESRTKEYKYEYLLHIKPHFGNIFPTLTDFNKAIEDSIHTKGAMYFSKHMDSITANRSGTKTKQELFKLIRGYRSYPEFRNERTVENLYKRFKTNQEVDMPILLDLGDSYWCMSGNTRIDVAQQLGITPRVIVLSLPESEEATED